MGDITGVGEGQQVGRVALQMSAMQLGEGRTIMMMELVGLPTQQLLHY
jgi:hypothetical protein